MCTDPSIRSISGRQWEELALRQLRSNRYAKAHFEQMNSQSDCNVICREPPGEHENSTNIVALTVEQTSSGTSIVHLVVDDSDNTRNDAIVVEATSERESHTHKDVRVYTRYEIEVKDLSDTEYTQILRLGWLDAAPSSLGNTLSARYSMNRT